MNLEKTALITGAGRGLGRAIAVQLAKQGARLCLVARSKEQLEKTKALIHEVSPRHSVLTQIADVTDPSERAQAFRECEESFGGLDILVNNAGAIRVKDFEALTPEDYQLCIDTNLSATFFCSQLAFGLMKKARGGVILNISSLAGVPGLEKFQGFSAYSASKAAVIALSEALAVEGKPVNIQVNCLCPGAIDTQMLREALPDFKTNTSPDEVAGSAVKLIVDSFEAGLTGKVEILENA